MNGTWRMAFTRPAAFGGALLWGLLEWLALSRSRRARRRSPTH